MNDRIAEFVHRIHASPVRLALAVTGGGSLAISHLLTVPGGSRTVLECQVPYASSAMAALLGAMPERFCSSATARAMAMATYLRAVNFSRGTADTSPAHEPPRIVGLACTAGLASDRPKKGPHRAWLAAQAPDLTLCAGLHLQKNLRTRLEEEQLVSASLLNLLAEVAGVSERLPVELSPSESLDVRRTAPQAGWRELIEGSSAAILSRAAAPVAISQSAPRLIFPGAFHPRHAGHRKMAETAADVRGQAVEHEISVWNVDKPPLDYQEMTDRAAQFAESEPLWFTRAPTFAEKAKIFPGAMFAVGADTIVRIGQDRYYGHDPVARDRAIQEIAAQGCRFLVFCRRIDGVVQALPDLELPPGLRALCQAVPAERFCEDISSTEIRRRRADES